MKINVDSLDFSFPANFDVIKFDDNILSFKNLSSSMQFPCECFQCPSHNCNHEDCPDFINCDRRKIYEGLKGVDLIAEDKVNNNLYLIESKDYRKFYESDDAKSGKKLPISHIVDEVIKKFRDTLFGIWCGSICDRDPKTQTFLLLARTKQYNIQFIFHFESPPSPYSSGLYKNGKAIPITNMQTLLRNKLSVMQNFVNVYDMDCRSTTNYPWTVTEKK